MNAITVASTIDIGAIATQAIIIAAGVFIPIIGAQAVRLLNVCLKNRGVALDAARSARLQAMIVNGLNAAAAAAEATTAKLPPAAIKDQAVAGTIAYVKAHGADTLKALGVDLSDPAQVAAMEDAVRARIETALNDPHTPTPAAITPAPTH